ncbi:DUF397 domain-containing protein [Actinomadura livida]|uniref:DNA relaxase NicK n=1 Tax=Actinomadura livida TaxID=79909 RepID=A0A7W7I865_9ACTN|nr:MULTISPECIES: DUF397 domain-containing protein [Actinomadura]MBB4772171.1 DNA relaxase NicK [Actinomadura catellatispora]GGU27412.1 hypothetical protein GCM10010208_60270 [Actinomadura livida]
MDVSTAVWKKASRSNESGDACIELASNGEMVAVRDSKDADGPTLLIGHREFRQFANVLKSL